ncbi:MAG: hypothetical protein ACE5EF_13970, partial [Dehalococcoidia bacterium]
RKLADEFEIHPVLQELFDGTNRSLRLSRFNDPVNVTLAGFTGDVHTKLSDPIDLVKDTFDLKLQMSVGADDTASLGLTKENAANDTVIIAGAGYTSVPVKGSTVPGTEEDQFIFLEQLRDAAETSRFELVIWLSAFDPPVSAQGTEAQFEGVGLRSADGTPKLAWDLWEEWVRRPPTAR